MHKQKGVTKANKYEQTSPTKLNQPRRSNELRKPDGKWVEKD